MISKKMVSRGILSGLCCVAVVQWQAPTADAQAGGPAGCTGELTESIYSVDIGPQSIPWSVPTLLPKIELAPGETLVQVTLNTYSMSDIAFSVFNQGRQFCEVSFQGDLLTSVAVPEASLDLFSMEYLFESIKLPPGVGAKLQLGGAEFANSYVVTEDMPGFSSFVANSPGELLFVQAQSDLFFDVESSCPNIVYTVFPSSWIEVEVRYLVCVEPEDCPSAEPIELWPPNHEYHAIDLSEILDPDGSGYVFVITGITQDEPINGTGDGNTECDGWGVGTDLAWLRAERKGDGDGRVYVVSYDGVSASGNLCSGNLMVTVPHSQNGDATIDSGQDYGSSEGCE